MAKESELKSTCHKAGVYPANIHGWACNECHEVCGVNPITEDDMKCTECKRYFDRSDLGQVVAHEHTGMIAKQAESKRVR